MDISKDAVYVMFQELLNGQNITNIHDFNDSWGLPQRFKNYNTLNHNNSMYYIVYNIVKMVEMGCILRTNIW